MLMEDVYLQRFLVLLKLYKLTWGGVPKSLGGVPVMTVVMPTEGEDVVTMVGETDPRLVELFTTGASLKPESVD